MRLITMLISVLVCANAIADTDYKPVVIMYVMDGCVPCKDAKNDLANMELPFVVIEVDASKNDKVENYPTFQWYAPNSEDPHLCHVGKDIKGPQGLLATWKYSMRKLADD